MTTVNSADLRSRMAEILTMVSEERKPVVVGRFGQPKAVLVDIATFNMQQTIISLLNRIDDLTPSEIETLDILIDKKTRSALIEGLKEIERGQVVPFDKI